MLVYYLLLVVVIALGYPLIERKPSDYKKVCYIVIVFIFMYYISYLRYGIGNDYFSYIGIYSKTNSLESFSQLFSGDQEFGFNLLNRLIGLIGGSAELAYGIYAIVIYIPIAYIFYKYSENVWLSTTLFICLTFFYTSLSFIRQSIACSIIFLGYRFIKERKHIPVVLLTLVAATFHISALVLIPCYFLAILIKPTPTVLAIYAGGCALLYLTSNQVIEFVVNNFLKNYSKYINSTYLSNGFSVKYMIVPAIFLVFSIVVYYSKYGRTHKESSVFVNFMIFNFIIWLFSTKHFIIERFSMYIYVFAIMFIPSVVAFYKKEWQLQREAKKAALAQPCVVEASMEAVAENVVKEQNYSEFAAELTEENKAAAQTGDMDIDKDTDKISDKPEKFREQIYSSAFYKKTSNSSFINWLKNTSFYKCKFAHYAIVMAIVLSASLGYNHFGLTTGKKGFHGVVPYETSFIPYMEFEMSFEKPEDKNELLLKEEDFYKYLLRLKNDDYLVYISVNGNSVGGLTGCTVQAMSYLGMNYNGDSINQSYICILDGGKMIYEETGKTLEDTVKYNTKLDDDDISLSSGGMYAGEYASIKVNQYEKCINIKGMNFLVYSKSQQKFVDSVGFKSYYLGLDAIRDGVYKA